MSRQIVCPVCKTLNSPHQVTCIKCHAALPQDEVRKPWNVRRQEALRTLRQEPDWLERWRLRAKTEKNPLIRFGINAAYGLWFVYMTIVAIIIWFIAWFTV